MDLDQVADFPALNFIFVILDLSWNTNANLDQGIITESEKRQKKKLLIDYLYANLKNHNFWAYRYFFCEFLGILNVVGGYCVRHFNRVMPLDTLIGSCLLTLMPLDILIGSFLLTLMPLDTLIGSCLSILDSQFETNTFCNLRKIHFTIWNKFILQFETKNCNLRQIHFAIWDKYILECETNTLCN